jgi:hypothetical protein
VNPVLHCGKSRDRRLLRHVNLTSYVIDDRQIDTCFVVSTRRLFVLFLETAASRQVMPRYRVVGGAAR